MSLQFLRDLDRDASIRLGFPIDILVRLELLARLCLLGFGLLRHLRSLSVRCSRRAEAPPVFGMTDEGTSTGRGARWATTIPRITTAII